MNEQKGKGHKAF